MLRRIERHRLGVFLTVLAALLVDVAHAGAFFPTVQSLSKTTDPQRAGQARMVADLLARLPEDALYVRVDDMLFRAQDLRNAGGFYGNRWTNGIIYYQFDANVSAANRLNWEGAAQESSQATSLQFVQRTNQPNYILVRNHDSENSSAVGMAGGQQPMNIHDWVAPGVILHEIGHAIGLDHEHQRSDRDAYVRVLTANIQSGKVPQFEVEATENYGPYDFDSLMHYPKDAFSANGQNTLEPLTDYYPRWIDRMGQSDHLSVLDQAAVAHEYGPDPAVIEAQLQPVADAMVDESASMQNFGAATVMTAGVNQGTRRWALLNFDMCRLPVGLPIQSATLRLRCSSLTGTGQQYELRCANGRWTETVVTWTLRPFYQAAPFKSFMIAGGGSNVQLNLLDFITQWMNQNTREDGLLIRLATEGLGGSYFASFNTREAMESWRPQLTVRFSPPGASSSTPTMTSTNTPAPTHTPTFTPSATPTPTPTSTATSTPTITNTDTPAPTHTPTDTSSATPTPSPDLPAALDLNHDGAIDAADLLLFLECRQAQDMRADFNLDRRVDDRDLFLFSNYWNP